MTEQAIDNWFDSLPDSQKQILDRMRNIITTAVADVTEEFKWSRPCYSVEGKLFCYLQSTKKHAVLGFQNGASLPDSKNLLEGTGKDMRHIKLKSLDAGDEECLQSMIVEAAKRSR